jgi:hypothetical protein
MRNREALNLQVAELDSCSGLEHFYWRGPAAPFDQVAGKLGQENRAFQFPGDRTESGDVIAVLVRDENRVDLLRILADGAEALERFPTAESGVNQDSCAISTDECAIT